ncbi:hypothetical protein D3C76_290290 [compost metagenome]
MTRLIQRPHLQRHLHRRAPVKHHHHPLVGLQPVRHRRRRVHLRPHLRGTQHHRDVSVLRNDQHLHHHVILTQSHPLYQRAGQFIVQTDVRNVVRPVVIPVPLPVVVHVQRVIHRVAQEAFPVHLHRVIRPVVSQGPQGGHLVLILRHRGAFIVLLRVQRQAAGHRHIAQGDLPAAVGLRHRGAEHPFRRDTRARGHHRGGTVQTHRQRPAARQARRAVAVEAAVLDGNRLRGAGRRHQGQQARGTAGGGGAEGLRIGLAHHQDRVARAGGAHLHVHLHIARVGDQHLHRGVAGERDAEVRGVLGEAQQLIRAVVIADVQGVKGGVQQDRELAEPGAEGGPAGAGVDGQELMGLQGLAAAGVVRPGVEGPGVGDRPFGERHLPAAVGLADRGGEGPAVGQTGGAGDLQLSAIPDEGQAAGAGPGDGAVGVLCPGQEVNKGGLAGRGADKAEGPGGGGGGEGGLGGAAGDEGGGGEGIGAGEGAGEGDYHRGGQGAVEAEILERELGRGISVIQFGNVSGDIALGMAGVALGGVAGVDAAPYPGAEGAGADGEGELCPCGDRGGDDAGLAVADGGRGAAVVMEGIERKGTVLSGKRPG